MKRALAVAAAVVMVAGAILIRRAIDDTSTPSTTRPSTARSISLLCSTEFNDACQQLAKADTLITARPEAPGDTTNRLAKPGATLGADAWIVADPWADIVRIRRSVNDLPDVLDRSGTPVGTANLDLALAADQRAALEKKCGPSTVSWKCLAANASRPLTDGGPALTIGIAPASYTSGLLTATAFTVAEIGKSTLSTNDLSDHYDSLSSTLANVTAARGARTDAPSPVDILLGQPAYLTAVGLGGYATTLTSTPLRGIVAITPTPVISARAMIFGAAGTTSASVVSRLGSRPVAAAMNATGWSTSNSASKTALPDAAVIDAIGQLWKDLTK